MPFLHGIDIMRCQRQNIECQQSKRQPERMRHKAGCVQNKGQQRAAQDQADAEGPSAGNLQAQEQNHGYRAEKEQENQLGKIRHLCLSPALQKTLDHIGLNLRAVHLGTLVNGREIGILQGRGKGADDHDPARPIIGRYLSADQSGDRNTVVVATRACRVGNVKMAHAAGMRGRQFLSLLLQIAAGGLEGHGIYPAFFASVGLHIQEPVPHHAVDIRHGIDMPLSRTAAQTLVRFLVGKDSRCLHLCCVSVLPGDLLSEPGHGSCDHIAQIFGRCREPVICLLRAAACIENVDGSDGGLFFRICRKCLQGGSHDIPVPGIVGTQELQCLLIDSDDNNITGRDPGALEEPVLCPPVQASEHPQTDKQSHQQRRCNGK